MGSGSQRRAGHVHRRAASRVARTVPTEAVLVRTLPMADPPSDFPTGLQAPAGGDLVAFAWRANLGEGVRVGDLADHFHDLDTAVGIGEQWGLVLARAASRAALINQVTRQGPGAVEVAARELGYRGREVRYLEEWLMGEPPWRRPPFGYLDPWGLLSAIADTRAPDILGTPTRVIRAQYNNPVEVVLTGSGFLILGTIYIARLVRDWSHIRRAGQGQAREAEASARRAEASADLYEWLVDEAKAGRLRVPPGDLLNGVPPGGLPALTRLAGSEVTLDLPQNLGLFDQDTPGQ